MFDLVEEELLEKENTNETKKPPFTLPTDTVIYAMPDKFRKKEKSSSGGIFIIIGVLVLVVIATIGGALYFLLGQSHSSLISLPTTSENKKDEPQKKNENSSESTIPQDLLALQATSTQSQVETVPVQSTQQQQTQSVEQKNTTQQQGDQLIVQSKDSDGDTLTDKEEDIWGTDPQKPDSEGDGFRDDEELLNLYDPTKGDRAPLKDSGVAHTYTNETFKYAFMYPSKTLASASNSSDKDVIIAFSTGELMSVTVKDNPQRLSPSDLYKTEVSKNGSLEGTTLLTRDGISGIVSPDKRSVILVPVDISKQISRPLMVVLTYNLNSQTEMNFMQTFNVIIRSLTFL